MSLSNPILREDNMNELLLLLIIGFVGFLAGLLDITVGTGYGNVLTPLLLLLNFPVLETIPAVLFSQIAASFVAALAFHYHGNIQLTKTSEDTKAIIILSITGIFGVIVAMVAFLFVFSINPFLLQLLIAISVIVIGLIILIKFHWEFTFSKLFALGIFAGFLKGLSGGGYTPLVAGGQMVTGRETKQAIGSVNIPKAIISIVAVLLYLFIGQMIFDFFFFFLAIPLTLGAVLSSPLASYFVKVARSEQITFWVGIAILLIGLLTIAKTVFQIL